VKVSHGPGLASSDFRLFLHLTEHLAFEKFHEDEDLKNEVAALLRAQMAEFCDVGIQKLVKVKGKVFPLQA
jgi:hypothetical protein